MNIIWITPEIPYPPIGGRNGVYNRIVQLSKYNNIFLLSIAYDTKEEDSTFFMKKYCKEVHYFNRGKNKKRNFLKSLYMPWSVASRNIPELKKMLVTILEENDIDVIIDDFPNMAKNLLDIRTDHSEMLENVYCTLNQHNIEYLRMREMRKVKSVAAIKRVAYYLESVRLELYEKRVYESGLFKSITFFSSDDKIFFEKRWENIKSELAVFPLGANRSTLTYSGNINTKSFLFVGRLDEIAIPNVEAVIWFAKDIFPIIKKEEPEAKFIIAGANPSARILQLQSDSIEIIPNYEKLEDVYFKSEIVVLPLLSGGGVKGKLLEAAAWKKLIITTSHGIEGTEYHGNNEVLLADTIDEFAKHCIDAIKTPFKFSLIREAAYKKFEERYDWKSIGKQYQEFIMRNNFMYKGVDI